MEELISVCRLKINRGVITSTRQDYEGSLALDANICKLAGVEKHEHVYGVNLTTGARFETYIIPGEPGMIELRGGTALLGKPGDRIGMLFFSLIARQHAASRTTRIVILDDKNEIMEVHDE
jgi:aspartate 1-decarboxylase